MNTSKVLCIVAFIAICCFTYTYAIKCYSCDSKDSCKSAKKADCTYLLANNTRSYLDMHHTGVNPNTTSPNMECFGETIKSNAGEFHYKGCVYSNINACQLPLRDIHAAGTTTRSCIKCNNKDLCNPAGRASLSSVAMISTVIMGVVARYIWA
uniref:Secreted protein n=1 Tax=Haematobia irritans TaxID=7368 RepID=A0A1L8EFL6_HAEIR